MRNNHSSYTFLCSTEKTQCSSYIQYSNVFQELQEKQVFLKLIQVFFYFPFSFLFFFPVRGMWSGHQCKKIEFIRAVIYMHLHHLNWYCSCFMYLDLASAVAGKSGGAELALLSPSANTREHGFQLPPRLPHSS